ncbi:hypothetical protein M8818_006403 [Zalaria obscura]|uniref:Uncharacterized protein n=1 Tax=Zalaria obscura TaxID=2024903 RepID=A0ACC3S6R0_9PEZI
MAATCGVLTSDSGQRTVSAYGHHSADSQLTACSALGRQAAQLPRAVARPELVNVGDHPLGNAWQPSPGSALARSWECLAVSAPLPPVADMAADAWERRAKGAKGLVFSIMPTFHFRLT